MSASKLGDEENRHCGDNFPLYSGPHGLMNWRDVHGEPLSDLQDKVVVLQHFSRVGIKI